MDPRHDHSLTPQADSARMSPLRAPPSSSWCIPVVSSCRGTLRLRPVPLGKLLDWPATLGGHPHIRLHARRNPQAFSQAEGAICDCPPKSPCLQPGSCVQRAPAQAQRDAGTRTYPSAGMGCHSSLETQRRAFLASRAPSVTGPAWPGPKGSEVVRRDRASQRGLHQDVPSDRLRRSDLDERRSTGVNIPSSAVRATSECRLDQQACHKSQSHCRLR